MQLIFYTSRSGMIRFSSRDRSVDLEEPRSDR